MLHSTPTADEESSDEIKEEEKEKSSNHFSFIYHGPANVIRLPISRIPKNVTIWCLFHYRLWHFWKLCCSFQVKFSFITDKRRQTEEAVKSLLLERGKKLAIDNFHIFSANKRRAHNTKALHFTRSNKIVRFQPQHFAAHPWRCRLQLATILRLSCGTVKSQEKKVKENNAKEFGIYRAEPIEVF